MHSVAAHLEIMTSLSTPLVQSRQGHKYPLSLTFAADRLGTSAAQLGRVLNGRCTDYGLAAAYKALCSKHASNATNKRRPRARLAGSAAAAA